MIHQDKKRYHKREGMEMAEGKKGFFGRLVQGLSKTRDNIISGVDSIFHGFSSIDDEFYDELEETLIMGDIGINATMSIMENLKEKLIVLKNKCTWGKMRMNLNIRHPLY